MLDEKSNIKKFQELFEMQSSKNGIDDVLNLVFNLKNVIIIMNYQKQPDYKKYKKFFNR